MLASILAPPSAAMAAAIGRRGPAEGPALLFDLDRIAARMAAVAALARRHDIRTLLACKSFPAPAVVALAAAALDGFDTASPAEWRGLGAAGHGRILSITDPALGPERLRGAAEALAGATTVVVACETAAQVAAVAAALPAAIIAARLSASWLVPGDDALGGLASGDGRRESRFGIPIGAAGAAEVLADLVAAAPGRVRAVHVHHGALVATAPARIVATARAAVAAAAAAGLALEVLDLGGGLHGVAGELEPCLAAVRAAVPAAVEIIVEPGRLFAGGAGFAVGHVRVARDVGEQRVRVVDLSRSCHLRWSQLHVVGPAPRPGEARRVSFVGPTCYEDDVLGDWRVGPRPGTSAIYDEGTALVLGGVTGYALAWNTGFAGVPPADVVLVP